MSIILPSDVEAIVNAHVADGDFSSASEMIAAAVRLLNQRKLEKVRQVDYLRTSLQEAVDQMERGEWFDGDEVFNEVLRELEATGTVVP